MPSFTVRVELHNKTASYERLHAEMEKAGFSRTLAGPDGTLYRLPTAEYVYEGDKKADKVGLQVRAIVAESNNYPAWVLVTEAAARAWTLDPVR